jgi:hypothetical protein
MGKLNDTLVKLQAPMATVAALGVLYLVFKSLK